MSTFWTQATGGPGQGLFPSEVEVNCINRSGATMAKGVVVQLDLGLLATGAAATSNASGTFRPGGTTSVFRSIIAPTAAGVRNGILGVVTEPDGIANDAEGSVQFFGIVEEAYVFETGGSAALNPGDTLVASATSNALTGNAPSSERIIAIYQDAQDATPTNRSLHRILFDGLTFTAREGD